MRLLPALLALLVLPWPGFADGREGGAREAAADLVAETLRQDIETAGYYELLAWCRQLGLEDAGTRQALVDRLRNYYRLPQSPRGVGAAAKRILTISSARSAEYFTIQEIDENYVLLQGDVLVELKEGEATHRIRAQKILLNQTANLLTAEGNIEYTFQKGEHRDLFRGRKITFDVESWEGVFFGGGMEGDRDVGGKKVHFYFDADSIAKLQAGTVVMDRGLITSCDIEGDPHYHIEARKIWVLAPGEWAISNAVLYIGRIPVLWVPFFFRPGDEFFFHPAIGSRTREGNFLQTTTYLIGRKKRSPSAISVLAAAEPTGQQYQREIRGLFLRQKEGEQIPVKEDRMLKVLLDYYSRLGGFAGVIGDFPPQVSFRAGLGISRNIYSVGGFYTPYEPSAGASRSVWNSSWVFGAEVPFRYGTEAKWNLAKGGYRLSGKFEYFSDPTFTTDFFNRSEETAVSKLLGLEPSPTSTQLAIQTAESEKVGLSWELSGQGESAKLATEPYLKKISVPYLSGNLSWQSRINAAIDPEDPARKFYYPVSLKLPNAAVQLSGDLISIQARPKVQAAPKTMRVPSQAVPIPLPAPLRLPEASGPNLEPSERKTESGLQDAEPALRPPAPKENLTVPAASPASFLLSYQVRPTLVMEQSFNSEDWAEPSQVRYDLDYTSLSTSGTSSLDWVLKMYEQLLSLSGSLSVSGSYQRSFRQSLGDADWVVRVDRDRRGSQALLRNIFTVSFSPFPADPRFRATNVSYSLNWNVLRYLYDESASAVYGQPIYEALGPEWNAQTFSQHQLKAILGWQPAGRLNSLTLICQLPPLNASISAKGEWYFWLLKTTVNTVFRQGSESWPFSVQEVLELSPQVNFSQEVQADLFLESFEKSVTALNFWGLSSSFTAQRLAEGGVAPTYVTVAYRLAQKEWYFWKNRIRAQLAIQSNWSMNLQNFLDNRFNFSFSMKYFVYQFLELSFTSISYNNQTYLYFPSFAGASWRNPIVDLFDSFNFFDDAARRRSAFKLKSVLFEMIHHLHDWDLTLRYEGKPSLITGADGRLQYTWYDSFSILLQWIPIPEMRSTMRGDPSGFFIRG